VLTCKSRVYHLSPSLVKFQFTLHITHIVLFQSMSSTEQALHRDVAYSVVIRIL